MKHNIEHDLLKTLKSSQEELIYTLFNMANDTYQYKIKYLNQVPYEIKMLYLEKIIAIGINRREDVQSLEELIVLIEEFSNSLGNLKFSDLSKKSDIKKYYDRKILQEKMLNLIRKPKVKKTTICLLLSAVLFFSLCSKEIAKEQEEVISDTYVAEEVSHEIAQNMANFVSMAPVIVLEASELEEITLEDKIENICSEFNLTEEEFNVVCAIVLAESKANSYDDAYAVINTIYNRTISNRWVTYISSLYDVTNAGESLYYQAITPGQFVIYENGRYKEFLGVREGEGFNAIIDFLTTKKIVHDYLFFRSSDTEVSVFEQFTESGNKYFDVIEENDRIQSDNSLSK